MSGRQAPLSLPLAPEDEARADLYTLIACLLQAAPDAALLQHLAGADTLVAEPPGNPLEQAWEKLVMAAAVVEAKAVREEFDTLFVGIGTPRINPYACLYLAGFLMEKPLAALRADLGRLGLARVPGIAETEDHLAALCETMRLLITGMDRGGWQPLSVQKTFFATHLAPWYGRCLADIRQASGANFYRLVADLAEAFFDLERQAFDLEEAQAAWPGDRPAVAPRGGTT